MARSDISIDYNSSRSGVGVRGETGSGDSGSGDCVVYTSDSDGGGGGSGIAHIRGDGNNSYSGGVSEASVDVRDCAMGGSGNSEVVAAIAPVVTLVAAAASVSSAKFTHGAIFAPAATVGYFTPRTVLASDIAVVAASTAPVVSSVEFAASAGANDSNSGWGDFEKPLDMLLEDKMEMWKGKQNVSMDEGT